MYKKVFGLLGMVLLLGACGQSKKITGNSKYPHLDMEAHRGGRGLMPENTIPAMLDAIDRGMTTLEMDLQITRDKQVLVSHDATINGDFSLDPQGKPISKEQSKGLILYKMDYADIKKYDVGLKPFPAFPRQKKMAVNKPLLKDLIDATEAYAKKKGVKIQYNIEIKSNPKNDGVLHPPVQEFVDLALGVINQKGIGPRTILQSFDVRTLRLMHAQHPNIRSSYLVDAKENRPIAEQFKALGFVPAVYSPHFTIVTETMVKECHQRKVKVIPWTPNDLPNLQRMVDMGVDGVITDYPDLFAQLR